MGRAKKAQPPKPWESPTTDPKGAGNFGKVYQALIKWPAFKKLPLSARYLYITMLPSCAGKQSFHFTVDEAEECGNARGTFRRAVKILIQAGFIRIKESGKDRRQATVYEFVNGWKAD